MQTHTQAAGPVEVLVDEPGRLDELLDHAEAVLRRAAAAHGCAGILVTRHDPGRYTLALSDTVPFGQTREHRLPRTPARTVRQAEGSHVCYVR